MRLTKSNYARHRGVTPTAVGHAIREGRIQEESDGTIDVEKADLAWRRNTVLDYSAGFATQHATQASVGPVPHPTLGANLKAPLPHNAAFSGTLEEAGVTQQGRLVRSRTKLTEYKAIREKISIRELRKELFRVDDVLFSIESIAVTMREELLSLPMRVLLKAGLSHDRNLELLLDSEVRYILESVSVKLKEVTK